MHKKKFLVVNGKAPAAAGWWTAGGTISSAVAAWAAKGAASQTASYINLANPGTYNLGVGSAITSWDTSTGWYFNNGSGYLTTGITDSTGWSFIIRFGTTTGGEALSAYDGTNGVILCPHYLGGNRVYFNGNSANNVATGYLSNSTMGVAALHCYQGGVADGDIGGANNACTRAPFIGARNNSGTANTFYYGYILAAAIYNTTLNGTQMGALHTAMMAL